MTLQKMDLPFFPTGSTCSPGFVHGSYRPPLIGLEPNCHSLVGTAFVGQLPGLAAHKIGPRTQLVLRINSCASKSIASFSGKISHLRNSTHNINPSRLDIFEQPKQSKCRATSRSVPSRSWPRPRSRTAPSPNGFVCEPVTPSDTTPSVGTGARPVSASKCHFFRIPLQSPHQTPNPGPWFHYVFAAIPPSVRLLAWA
ncbi:hypothetical protein BX600DRAFT_214827 [Xylariales sp. PMI_506]|nr:hypothetical protein BX600DRAFT_214827 [Xylariales sp. PMI_506]